MKLSLTSSAPSANHESRDEETARWLLHAVCHRCGADPVLVATTRTKKPRERAARAEWFVALWASGWSLAHIGRVTGFNHTSVMYAVHRELGEASHKVAKAHPRGSVLAGRRVG